MMVEKPDRNRALFSAGILALALVAAFPAAPVPSARARGDVAGELQELSLIHISEPTRPRLISYAVVC